MKNIILSAVYIISAHKNVNIGTTKSTAKLHVNGTLKINDGSQRLDKFLQAT